MNRIITLYPDTVRSRSTMDTLENTVKNTKSPFQIEEGFLTSEYNK